MADARSLQAPLTALLARGHGFRLSMLMPAGPMSEAEFSPPLLLSLPDDSRRSFTDCSSASDQDGAPPGV